MQVSTPGFALKQRGISLVGLIVILAVLGVIGILAAKIAPAYMENAAINKAIQDAKANGGTVVEVQRSFNKAAEVQDITSIRSSDLIISKETGDTEISYAYEKVIPLVGNASLVLAFEGTTAKDGGAPAAE